MADETTTALAVISKEDEIPKAATKEALEMLSMSEVVGRYSSGWDADTDFDALPTRLVDITKADVQSAELFQGEGEPVEFEEPLENFPAFKQALRHFEDTSPKSRAVRVDTDASYEIFGADKAVKELERRVNELRANVEAHESDEHGGAVSPMRQWDEIMGAAEALSKATSGKDAIEKMPQVPLTVPDFAKGAVKCWQDGEMIVVSIRFETPKGPRIATMGSKPVVDTDEITQWAEREGHDPVTLLGLSSKLAEVATGKKLVRDTAAAALEVQSRASAGADGDMEMGDDEPVILIGLGSNTAPLAALMYLQQRAEAGDAQAQKELAIMDAAALTPLGKKVAAPVLSEARRRLALGRGEKDSYAAKYAQLAAFV